MHPIQEEIREPNAFYAWSEKAREKKAECDDGNISLAEYQEWLKNF